MKKFTFCVLAFNHESYIVEHLESIKFLVENYGQEIDCELTINDDASTDNTVSLINSWLLENNSLFSKVNTIFNANNLGTCASVINIVNSLNTEHCKITAADDIYSYINIFEFVANNPGYSLLSGIPIRLVDAKISVNRFECFNYFASDVVYKNKSFFDRITNLSIVNAPNIFYSTRHLKDESVLNFIKGYDVVEDWPLQIAIAKEDGDSGLKSTTTPIVYYRRTNNSTYMVASSRFVKDQLKVLDFLIDECRLRHKSLSVFLLKNRRALFLRGRLLKNLLNASRLIYVLNVVCRLLPIYKRYNNFEIDIDIHQGHADLIRKRSLAFDRNEK